MAKNHNLATFSEDKNTKSLNAQSREKIASFRSLVLDSDLLKEVLTMALTGYNCVVRDGEVVIKEDELLSEDVRFKYLKLLTDKTIANPKEVEEDQGEKTDFLKRMDIVQAEIVEREEKDKHNKRIQVIEPVVRDVVMEGKES